MELLSCMLFGLLFDQHLDNLSLADTVQNRFKLLRWGMEEWEVEAALRVWVNPEVTRRGYGIWNSAVAIMPSTLSIRPDLELHLCYQSDSDTNSKWVLKDAKLFRGDKLVGCLSGAFLMALHFPSPSYRALTKPLLFADSPDLKVSLVKFWMYFLKRGMDHSAALRLLGVDETWKLEIIVSSSFGGSADYTLDGGYRLSIDYSWDREDSQVLHDVRLYKGKELISQMAAEPREGK